MSPRSRTRPPATARLVFLALASAVATVLVYRVFVTTAAGQSWDDYRGLGWDEARLRRAGDGLLDTIGVPSLAILGGLIMLVALIRGRPRLALAAGVMILGANATVQAMKAGLERPALDGEWWSGFNSFPSGHVAVAMSLAMAALLVAPHPFRLTVALAGSAYAASVGVAVIALEWHRPSDVVGSYLVVTAWTATVAAALTLWPDRARPTPTGRPRARAWSALLALALGGAIALVAARAAGEIDAGGIVDDRTGLVVASLFFAALAGGLVAAVFALTGGLTGTPGDRTRTR